ncbi:MAG: hypothetical protein R3E32_29340 [Chitinophagales bacterium]
MNNHLINVYFRVDANRQIGTGHLVRCQIMAEKMKKIGMKCTFLLYKTPTFYELQLKDKGFEVIYMSMLVAKYAERMVHLIHNQSLYPHNLLVIDSDEEAYYTAEFQEKIRANGIKLMMIAFKHREPFFSDIVHNQNILALEYQYKTAPYTKCLLGTGYVILKEVYKTMNLTAQNKDYHNLKILLINFGGADRSNQTYKALKGVYESGIYFERIVIVVGILYLPVEELRVLIREYDQNNTSLHINTDRMPQFQLMADLAITSGGLTAWELACLGTPNFVIPTSYREMESALLMHKKDLVYYIGQADMIKEEEIAQQLNSIVEDFPHRQQMARRFHDMVAPNGCDKVIQEVSKLFYAKSD